MAMMGFTHDWLMTLCNPMDCAAHGLGQSRIWYTSRLRVCREAASIQGFQREVHAMTDKCKVVTETQRTWESRRMVRLVVSLWIEW